MWSTIPQTVFHNTHCISHHFNKVRTYLNVWFLLCFSIFLLLHEFNYCVSGFYIYIGKYKTWIVFCFSTKPEKKIGLKRKRSSMSHCQWPRSAGWRSTSSQVRHVKTVKWFSVETSETLLLVSHKKVTMLVSRGRRPVPPWRCCLWRRLFHKVRKKDVSERFHMRT